MSRKLLFGVLALALVAAACGGGKPGSQEVPVQFLPQVVDHIDNVGLSPSVAVDPDGEPVISYIGLPEELEPGEIPVSRPIGAPVVPAVLTAQLTKDGLWLHGAAVESTLSSTKPVTIPLVASNDTSIAVDSDDVSHVVWTQIHGVYYANDKSGQFGKPKAITKGYASGASVAVDEKGTPWVAYYETNSLKVATLSGKKWSVQTVGPVGACPHCPTIRTSTQVGPGGPAVAYVDPGSRTPFLATFSGGAWSVAPIDATGSGGFGISLAIDDQGTDHVTYYTLDGEVRHAEFSRGAWKVDRVASFKATDKNRSGWDTSLALDKEGVDYVAWYNPSRDEVRVATNKDGPFEEITTEGTAAGRDPALAVTPDGRVYVAWYNAVDQDLYLGAYPESKLQYLAVPSPVGPVTGTVALPPATCKPSGAKLEITAPVGAAGAGFDKDCLAASAGKPFTLQFTNEDLVPHNVEIFTDTSATERLGGATDASDTITGPGVSTTYEVDGLKGGTYFFRCDVHPTVMIGTFVVK